MTDSFKLTYSTMFDPPPGVFNFVTGPGGSLGEALITHPDVAGATFTGSYAVGMHLYRTFAQGRWPRPCIAEMGGKNAAIVSRHGDIGDAALGVTRSAFGLSGQKCSACSRVYVEHTAFADFVAALHAATGPARTSGRGASRPRSCR